MKTNAKHPPTSSSCRRTRIAESSIAAVDVCACGMMQLHLGALTLRMEPRAVSELAATLHHAVAKHAAGHDAADAARAIAVAFGSNGRGEA